MKNYLVNDQIKANSVLLISDKGDKMGIYDLKKALFLASYQNLDLVCINETAKPIVCKMMDYSKFKYNLKKKEKENKAKIHETEMKEIQLRPQIQDHDLEVKIKKANEELQKKNRIRVVVSFKGRQITHPELGFDILNKFIESTAEYGEIYKAAKLEGKRIEAILTFKKDKGNK